MLFRSMEIDALLGAVVELGRVTGVATPLLDGLYALVRRRAIEAGGAVIYQPLAGALHYTSTSDVPSRTVQAHKARSLARYFRKFAKGPLERLCVELAVPFIGLGLTLRARKNPGQ